MTWSSDTIRAQFPILQRQVHGHSLVYLDNAATTQKPKSVIDAISEYYSQHNANVHRGVHTLGDESTQIWVQSRRQIAQFFGASAESLILTRNSTEALNLAAQSWGQGWVEEGDVVAVTLMEHHSNFVPWQRLAQDKGARFVVLPLLPDGRLDLEQAKDVIDTEGDRLKVLALTHISNATGALNPIELIVEYLSRKSWRRQTLVVVDGAQSAARLPIHFESLGIDAFAFSGHKMYGPMGIGGLLVKKQRLEEFPPVLLGGGMIGRVSTEETTYADDWQDRFTAGTPDVASAAGLATACSFLQSLGREQIAQHDQELTNYTYQQLSQLPELELVGPNPKDGRWGSVAFMHKNVHAHDVAQVLDRQGVATRSGHHCTMPLHTHNNWLATTRVSFGVYNTKAEVDHLVSAFGKIKEMF